MTRIPSRDPVDVLAALARIKCTHPSVVPEFDEQAAMGLSTDEIKRRWPRYFGPCSSCDFNGVLYASYAHYLAGDW